MRAEVTNLNYSAVLAPQLFQTGAIIYHDK